MTPSLEFEMLSILDCVENLLRDNIELTPFEFQSLNKFKKVFRKLVEKGTVSEKKKNFDSKRGFFTVFNSSSLVYHNISYIQRSLNQEG